MNRHGKQPGLLVRFASLLLMMGMLGLNGCSQYPEATPTSQPVRTDTPSPTRTATALPTITRTLAPSPTLTALPALQTWEEEMSRIRWVAYSPTNADPNRAIEATRDSLLQDLQVLRQAGFTGLVTYTASGILGEELPGMAQEQGFEGLVMGIWDPNNQDEIATAAWAAQLPIVLGYCVGNEGLDVRYDLTELTAAIEQVKSLTQRHVTTTEEIDDYADQALLSTGDWVYPNAHPYFHNLTDPELAVRWTKAAYEDFTQRSGRFVMFKEVGLPTAGDSDGQLSEENQKLYYEALAITDVKFVYFEAFDQVWKTHLPIEPYWGLFKADRSPKSFAATLFSAPSLFAPGEDDSQFYVYRDVDYLHNHFYPSGYMGDIGDIAMDVAYSKDSYSGNTSIQFIYDAQGRQSTNCGYSNCMWAGVYWQEPANNWGKDGFLKDYGYDLTGYNWLRFWAKADQDVSITFKVGGIVGPYGDSLEFPRATIADLTQEWQEFEIDLRYADLSHIIGGFVWVSNWNSLIHSGISDRIATFYLDEIRYEK